MNKHVISNIDSKMSYIIVPGVEAEQISGLKINGIHMDTIRERVICYTAGCVSKLPVDILDKPGTVKSALRRLPSPLIWSAYILERVSSDLFPKLRSCCFAELGCRFKTAFCNKGGGDIAFFAIDDYPVPVVRNPDHSYGTAKIQLIQHLRRHRRRLSQTNTTAGDIAISNFEGSRMG